MTATTALAALTGIAITGGLLLIAAGWYGHTDEPRPPRPEPTWLRRLHAHRRQRGARHLIICTAAAVAAIAVTGWVAAGIVAALGVYGLPAMIGPDRQHKHRLARIEAIATWTENLRDTLSAAAGLEQAIAATAITAPEAIRPEIGRLAARLRAGERLPAALRRLSAELDDPTGDLVVTALVMAAERHARNITDLLSTLATTARDQAQQRLETATARARTHTKVRVIIAVTVSMGVGLLIFDKAFMAPYGSPAGQLMLLIVAAIFAVAFKLLTAMAKVAEPSRLLGNPDAGPPTQPAAQPRPSVAPAAPSRVGVSRA